MRGTRATTTVVIGSVLTGLLLTGCSAFGGDDSVPKPTRQTSVNGGGQDATPIPTPGTEAVRAEQVVPAGTVVAETDAVSKSGDTSIHVRVVAETGGIYSVHLSGYRTTIPQPMAIEFRHRQAGFHDGNDPGVRGFVQWVPPAGPPDSYTLDAGARPDYLQSVVLVPMPSDDDSARPWVGSVLAVGRLSWKIPDPYPGLTVTVGAERPGAYGYVKEVDAVPTWYTVAHGDELRTVAKRFGVSQAEFRWMNPYLETEGAEDWLLEDDVLNVSPANR